MDPSAEQPAFREPSDSPTPGNVSHLHERTLPIRREEFEGLLLNVRKLTDDFSKMSSMDGWLAKKFDDIGAAAVSIDRKVTDNTTEIVSARSLIKGISIGVGATALIIITLLGITWKNLNDKISDLTSKNEKSSERIQSVNDKLYEIKEGVAVLREKTDSIQNHQSNLQTQQPAQK